MYRHRRKEGRGTGERSQREGVDPRQSEWSERPTPWEPLGPHRRTPRRPPPPPRAQTAVDPTRTRAADPRWGRRQEEARLRGAGTSTQSAVGSGNGARLFSVEGGGWTTPGAKEGGRRGSAGALGGVGFLPNQVSVYIQIRRSGTGCQTLRRRGGEGRGTSPGPGSGRR